VSDLGSDQEEGGIFQVPLPPPPFPPGRDVVYFTRGVSPRDERDSEDIMLRSVPRPVAQRFRAAAGGRGMTHAQYLAALVELHESMRQRADSGHAELAAELERLGLSTVSI
jgi:hypothetical protein